MNNQKRVKKSIIKRLISKISRKRIKNPEFVPHIVSQESLYPEDKVKEVTENGKFTLTQEANHQEARYNLPIRYADNRIVLLPRDPWWAYTYWDISEAKINEIISFIPLYERENLHWILRMYDITGVNNFHGNNANSFFDIDIHLEANNWYINVNKPECPWCIEIGLKNTAGKFFAVARSNIIKTPPFGISSIIDEEWALPDEEYYKVLGIYDLGKSSLERKKRFEEILKHQISSPLASWGISSLSSERVKVQDKFFLEVWTELILYGRTEHDACVTVGGQPIKLKPDGTFSLRYALPVGDYKFEVAAVSKDKKHKLTKTPAIKRFDK